MEIAGHARQQVARYDTVHMLDGLATAASNYENGFNIKIQSGETFTAKKLILATGIKDSMPDIPGFAECWGISVLHCPYCHGYEVRNQKTGILANGDGGFELSSLISNWTGDLTIFTNGPSTLQPQQTEKLQKHGIDVDERIIERIEHIDGYIENLVFADGSKTSIKALYAKVPFEQHPAIPQALGCEMTPEGYIRIDASHRTTVPGVFACGDNASRLRTVANAVSMGTTTGIMVNKELIEEYFQ
jgi:thioredoxin reductase